MQSKTGKYFTYITKIINSDDKKRVIKELLKEIISKGPVAGIKSFLHREIYNRDLLDNKIETDVAFTGTANLCVKEYNKVLKITLPIVIAPKVSIIISLYNEAGSIHNCIAAIYGNSKFCDYEIIIADNGSVVDVGVLKAQFENIIIIKNEKGSGLLKSCNNAATYASGEYIVFIDVHRQVQAGWLEELLFVFEHNKYAGIAGTKVLYADGHLQQAGGIVWQDGTAMSYGSGDNPDHSEYNYVKEVDFVSGGALMIAKILWKKTGGFDEQYSLTGYAAMDLCFQVRNMGYKAVYQPFSVAVNFDKEPLFGINARREIIYANDADQEKFYKKWQREINTKSDNYDHVFYERDRTVGERHIVVVDPYLPEIDQHTSVQTISNFIDALTDLNYSVKLLSENEHDLPGYRQGFQHKEIEVLYGNGSYFAKQGWRHYLNMNIRTLDAVILSRSLLCMQVVDFLRSNRYQGSIIYYEYDLNYLRVEKANEADAVAEKKVIKLAVQDYAICEPADARMEGKEHFSKERMEEVFVSIIQ